MKYLIDEGSPRGHLFILYMKAHQKDLYKFRNISFSCVIFKLTLYTSKLVDPTNQQPSIDMGGLKVKVFLVGWA